MPRRRSPEHRASTTSGYSAGSGPELGQPMCPRCLGALHRVSRRPLDRLISLIVPVRRYRCRAPDCAWIGNLRSGRFTLDARGTVKRYVTRNDRP